MVKVIALCPRRNDMSREDFEKYLRETHVPLLVKRPGLRRLVLNLARPDPTSRSRLMTWSARTGSMTRR